MKYMGSKRRIIKDILPILLKGGYDSLTWFVEPFVGGANSIDKVKGNLRLGADNNPYVIALLQKMQEDNFTLPPISEDLYQQIRDNKEDYPLWMVGYAGICLSFGAKFFGGYARDKAGKRDYQGEAQRNLQKQAPFIQGVQFVCMDYRELHVPPNSIVYCDPPYRGVTGYKDKFDHDAFWEWCRETAIKNRLFVSEYEAPEDFREIWKKEIVSSLTQDTGSKKGVERLFVYEGGLNTGVSK